MIAKAFSSLRATNRSSSDPSARPEADPWVKSPSNCRSNTPDVSRVIGGRRSWVCSRFRRTSPYSCNGNRLPIQQIPLDPIGSSVGLELLYSHMRGSTDVEFVAKGMAIALVAADKPFRTIPVTSMNSMIIGIVEFTEIPLDLHTSGRAYYYEFQYRSRRSMRELPVGDTACSSNP